MVLAHSCDILQLESVCQLFSACRITSDMGALDKLVATPQSTGIGSVSHLHSVTYWLLKRTCKIHLTGLNVSTSEWRFHQEPIINTELHKPPDNYHAINGYLLNLAQYYAVAKPSLISSARIIIWITPAVIQGEVNCTRPPARYARKKTVEAV